jgi:FkbM family methyltransferase
MQMQPLDVNAHLQDIRQQLNAMQMQIIRTRQVATAAQAELAVQRAGRPTRFAVEFTSQFGEDMLAWMLLGGQLEGFFIEAGAFDGYRYSVTYGFEAVGWTGLLVEALPDACDACRQRRPASRVVQAGLSRRGAPPTAEFHVLEDHYGGMLSYLKPTEAHVSATQWAKRRSVSVPVTTLNDLLKDHTGPIDLAVIDVEGGELDVLDGFDLARYKPRVLIIEDNSQGRDPAMVNYMSQFPYELAYRIAVNDVYVARSEAEIFERIKWMKFG